MHPGLKVLSPGLCTSVQDLGRFGWQALGMPVSGVLDGVSLRLANALVGNPLGAPVLEILWSGPTFEVVADRVRLALAGAGAGLSLAGGTIVPAWQSSMLTRGEVFQIALGRQSASACLAIEGGVAVPPVLGSASTYLRAHLGGFEGRALRRGDIVPLAIDSPAERAELRLPAPPWPDADQPVRVVLGPQQEYFTDEAMATLLKAEFRISQNADRMGMRLDGPALRHRQGWDIVSDAIATGAIQVPGSGQPILLLADHQTTGGYPKIATVVSADLPAVARRRPGDTIRFTAVAADTAEQLCRDLENRLLGLVAAIEPIAPTAALDFASLYRANLISGVVTGSE
jgi:allophanate hydrolase